MPKYELKEGKGETKGVYSLGKKAKSEALKKATEKNRRKEESDFDHKNRQRVQDAIKRRGGTMP